MKLLNIFRCVANVKNIVTFPPHKNTPLFQIWRNKGYHMILMWISPDANLFGLRY